MSWRSVETKLDRTQWWPKASLQLTGRMRCPCGYLDSHLPMSCRSLIALSLILSLLQFKPAPMYILDEVDAALDLSHTQNIGHLLRSRFKGSQFIVVSLKDGMFNNANVLFKTRFRDGTSVVERTSNRQSNKENESTSSPANRSKRSRDSARAAARA